MKTYKRTDANRPYTFAELCQKIPYLKKKEWKDILEKAIEKVPTLKEQAMHMNKVTDFYSPLVISVMATISPEFKSAKTKYDEEKHKNSPEAKLNRALKSE